jgi:hypothetical protein
LDNFSGRFLVIRGENVLSFLTYYLLRMESETRKQKNRQRAHRLRAYLWTEITGNISNKPAS